MDRSRRPALLRYDGRRKCYADGAMGGHVTRVVDTTFDHLPPNVRRWCRAAVVDLGDCPSRSPARPGAVRGWRDALLRGLTSTAPCLRPRAVRAARMSGRERATFCHRRPVRPGVCRADREGRDKPFGRSRRYPKCTATTSSWRSWMRCIRPRTRPIGARFSERLGRTSHQERRGAGRRAAHRAQSLSSN